MQHNFIGAIMSPIKINRIRCLEFGGIGHKRTNRCVTTLSFLRVRCPIRDASPQKPTKNAKLIFNQIHNMSLFISATG